MTGSVLVAGVGNIFLRDDGFGVEVASRLATRPMPEGVRVVDFGIRGLHLAYELLDGYDALVLVDAMSMGEPPGTVAVVEPDIDVSGSDAVAVDAHGMDPATVLATLAGLGGSVGRVLVVACEPAELDEGIGLSLTVAGAVDHAVDAVQSLLADICTAAGKGGRA